MMRNVTRKVVEIVGKKRGVDKTPLSCYSICIVKRKRETMTEQEAKMWIEEVTNDLVEIGYTIKEATALAWTKYLEVNYAY
jgi:hypothetical protein